ncbi:YncE family protein [Streptomyces sp. MB09-01]|uniref:YncE family protein n=1 Tax=Streptomyces sp. MB09-01 TaxID=3028666 RepID=UPI0029AA5CF9|nr:YncE family protein [Streptomyces sp. MB09-01]MDX3538636.1 YncE family protein [Streptomyces sp. MB09-01]
MSKVSNTEKSRVVATIPVGTGPFAVAVDVHGQVFVTSRGDNTVSVIKSSTNTVIATLNVGLRPESVATDPQFGVYVANSGNVTVTALDRFNTVVATLNVGPPGPPPNMLRVAIDHLMSRAYVTDRGRDRVSIIRTSAEPPFVTPDFVEVPGPLGAAVDPVDHRLYVTQPEFNTVSVIDPATNRVIGSMAVGQQPMGIAIAPQKRRVYVTNSGFTTVSVIDLATGGSIGVDVAAKPIGVAVDSHGNAYVTASDGTVKVIDALSIRVSDTFSVGSKPEGVAFEPLGNRVYVANRGDGTVSAIDLAAT